MFRRLAVPGSISALALAWLAPAALRAQPAALESPDVTLAEPSPGEGELAARPRLSLAAGAGATVDAAGFPDGHHLIPAFFAVGGFGDGLGGVELGSFSSSASGRFHGLGDNPIDRLALDAFGVLRPAARVAPGNDRYGLRVLRTVAAELGLGFERDGRTTGSGSRFEVHTGARIELPLGRAHQSSELRLRLALRRAFGLYTPKVAGATAADVTSVGDSTEAYAALAVVF